MDQCNQRIRTWCWLKSQSQGQRRRSSWDYGRMEKSKVKTLCRLTLRLKIKIMATWTSEKQGSISGKQQHCISSLFWYIFATLSHHLQQQRGRNIKFNGIDICRHTEFDSFLSCDIELYVSDHGSSPAQHTQQKVKYPTTAVVRPYS